MTQRPKQPVAQVIRDDLLRFLWQKFYADDPAGQKVAAKCFAQDQSKLLGWVILYPARFMARKGFTVTGERYKQIVSNIILDAIRHGNTTRLGYRPAWLKMVIERHFEKHWEEYYAEAKAVGTQAEHALMVLGKLQVRPEGDPVRTLAEAGALLARQKSTKKPRSKEASNLEFKL